MQILGYCLALAFMLAFIYNVYGVARRLQTADGTVWQRILAAFGHSQTVFVARLGAFVSAFSALAINVLPSFDPGTSLGSAVAAVLRPEWVPWYGLAFALLVEMVRRRPGSIDPITVPPAPVAVPPPPPGIIDTHV